MSMCIGVCMFVYESMNVCIFFFFVYMCVYICIVDPRGIYMSRPLFLKI